MPPKKRTRGDVEREIAAEAPLTTRAEERAAAGSPALTAAPTRGGGRTRRDVQRGIAESRAAYFARPDGASEEGIEVTVAPREQWPGPFSTAMRMIEERENARMNRETILALKATESIEAGEEEEADLDVYDTMLRAAEQSKGRRDDPAAGVVVQRLPSLVELSVAKLADNFECVEDMGDLPSDLRGLIALAVSNRRKLNSRALMALVPEGASSISIPDCSGIDEEGLQICFQNSVLVKDGGISPHSKLQVLNLHNCGGCFSDKIAETLLDVVSELEVLSLRGCFRLNDAMLSRFISASPKLRSLDLGCSLRVRALSLHSIGSLTHLTSLCLDNLPYLSDSEVEALAVPCMKHLTSVSLEGVKSMSNSTVIRFTTVCRDSLTSLNIKGCPKLDGVLLVHLRRETPLISHINLSDLPALTTADLLRFFSPISWEDESSSSSHTGNRRRAEFQSVTLNNLYSLVDDVIVQLCLSSANSLRTISVGGCHKLTGRMAMALVYHCSESLRDVDISFVRAITECSMLEVVSKCLSLSSAGVWGCSQLSHTFYQSCRERNIVVSGYLDKNE